MNLTLGTLKDMVVYGANEKLKTNTPFTSYDIWNQINSAWPSLQITEDDVRPLTRDYMESLKDPRDGFFKVGGVNWDYELRGYNGISARTWYPVAPVAHDQYGNVPPQAVQWAAAPQQSVPATASTGSSAVQPEPEIDVDVIVSFVIRSRK